MIRRYIPAALKYQIRVLIDGLTSKLNPTSVQPFYFGGHDRFRHRDLGRVNVFESTALCALMRRYGSDKAKASHNYTPVYARLVADPLRVRHVFELGLGTNNPALPSTMGVAGKPGASLRAWRDYFPNARIRGADIDRTILFSEERIQTDFCDQRDPAAIKEMWRRQAPNDQFDLIVDDGLHEFDANVCFLENSLEKLAVGGVFVVEDIAYWDLGKWAEWVKVRIDGQRDDLIVAMFVLPHVKNNVDNNLLIVERVAANESRSSSATA